MSADLDAFEAVLQAAVTIVPGENPPFERPIKFVTDLLRDLTVIRIWAINERYAASEPWHWWYSSPSLAPACLGDHCSLISWSGHGDMPSLPVDPAALQAWHQRMANS